MTVILNVGYREGNNSLFMALRKAGFRPAAIDNGGWMVNVQTVTQFREITEIAVQLGILFNY